MLEGAMEPKTIAARAAKLGFPSTATKNTIRVVTTRKEPADQTGTRETIMIVARRP